MDTASSGQLGAAALLRSLWTVLPLSHRGGDGAWQTDPQDDQDEHGNLNGVR
jgi:hypothetical protein